MHKQLSNKYIYWLILLTICVNFIGAFYPLLRNDDPVLYATISKNMVLSGNWFNLMYDQKDWLDKPHFPFWITGISFKIFGINSFAYILPGFLFHIIGAIFTYLLCLELLKDKQIALFSVLIYLTSIHLLISSIDVRAEAYLLGEIMGACYFWYKYDQTAGISFKYLVLGSIFSACAIMTKGPFVLITIGTGFVLMWIYQKKFYNLYSLKWLLAILLSICFTFPEIYSLYQQFDLHPEKVVFNRTGVSGILWFFWGSQFGRFLNNGYIKVNYVQQYHYLFFLHTFLWAFLPWSVFFMFAKIFSIKSLRKNSNVSNEQISVNIFLLGAFVPTFILFSLTKFQLDHYTNILMPFAAILCARWYHVMLSKCVDSKIHWVFYLQIIIATIFLILAVSLALYLLNSTNLIIALLADAIMLWVLIYAMSFNIMHRALVMSVLAINMVFVLITQINQKYMYYDPGYLAAKIVNEQANYPIIDYNVNSVTFNFYAKQSYHKVFKIEDIKKLTLPVYMLIKTNDISLLDANNIHYVVIAQIRGTSINGFIASLINHDKLKDYLTEYSILEIK